MRFNTPDDSTERDSLDAFGRLRTSDSHMQMSSQLTFDLRPLDWLTELTTGGTATHLPNESSASLATTASTGSKTLRQTRRYFLYRAGHSMLPIFTAANIAYETDVTKRVGLFDDNDGVFLQSDSTGISLVERSSTTGSPVDTAVLQSAWNRDTLDGTGISTINQDWTKTFIFWVDLQWLGVGTVRCGFDFNQNRVVAHEFRHGNQLNKVYMKTALLPCRYEIETTDSGGSGGTLKQICTAVAREGGEPEPPVPSAQGTGIATINATTTAQTLISFRLKSTHNRAYALPTDYSVLNNGSELVEARLVLNPTLGGALTGWTSVSTNSVLEYTINQQTYTAASGHTLGVQYLDSTNQTKSFSRQQIDTSIGLAAAIDGTADILSLIVDAASGSQPVHATMNFNELY